MCRNATLEKAMATHSGTLAWRILWMEEPGRLQSMGSQRVGHDWATSLSLLSFFPGYHTSWHCSWLLFSPLTMARPPFLSCFICVPTTYISVVFHTFLFIFSFTPSEYSLLDCFNACLFIHYCKMVAYRTMSRSVNTQKHLFI